MALKSLKNLSRTLPFPPLQNPPPIKSQIYSPTLSFLRKQESIPTAKIHHFKNRTVDYFEQNIVNKKKLWNSNLYEWAFLLPFSRG